MSDKPNVIPRSLPQKMLFCAHRQIPGLDDDGCGHMEIVGVHPAARAFEVIDPALLGRYWYFLYEVQTEYLLTLIRLRQTRAVPDDRLIVRGVHPKLDALLRTPEPVPIKPIHSIRIESMFDAYHATERRKPGAQALIGSN